LIKSKTKVIVPYPTVRNLLVQKDLGEKRANWITSLQEYDLEIKPTKIVKGKGLCKLAAESTHDKERKDELYQDQNLFEREVCYIPINSDQWYYEMKYYLTHGTTPHYMEPKKKRYLILKSTQYQLIQGMLCRKNYDGVYLRCLEKEDVDKVLFELHDGPTGEILEVTLQS
jgi:hypothetical protein